MSFLSAARSDIEDRLLPNLERRLDRKIGSPDRFYVRRRLFREDVDEQDRVYRLLSDRDASSILEETGLLDPGNHIVLGRSGAGKSVLALHTAVEAYRTFLHEEDAPFPVFLELGAEVQPGSSQNVRDALKRASIGWMHRALQQHEPGVHLIVDALDEMLRYERRMLVPLDTVLQDVNQTGRCQILLTTRRSQWEESDWNSDLLHHAAVYHVDEVSRYEYRQIVEDESEWSAFYDACKSNGLYDLLDTPFDGFDLAFRFRNGEPLPSSRREHLDQRVDERLRKNDGGATTTVSTSRLRELAGLLACVASFGESDSFTENEAVDALRGSALMDAGKAATEAEVERLLASRLFKSIRSDTASHYAFDHVFYREYLAAEVLHTLSLRKQRQLLCVPLDGRERIAAVHRGIARMLAESDPSFRDYLIDTDPPVAFFSTLSTLTDDERENLLRQVFDWAIDRHLTPWRTMEGTGETFRDVLGWHQLSSPSDFLRPYLSSDHEIAKMWAAHAACAWDGVSGVQHELASIALDPDERRDTRSRCVEALHRSCREQALPAIRQLLFDDSDQVRGAAFGAYWKLTDPSLAEVFFLLRKPKQQPNLSSLLRLEIRAYGRSLDDSEVLSAFHFLNVLPRTAFHRNRSDDQPLSAGLYTALLEGILERPERIDFRSPPVVPVLYRGAGKVRIERELTDILADRPEVWRHFFLHTYDQCGPRNGAGFASRETICILAESCTKSSLNLLPPPHSKPSRSQANLVRQIRREAGLSSPWVSEEPHLPIVITVPRKHVSWLHSPPYDPDLEPLSTERAVQAALSEGDPAAQVKRILEAVARLRNSLAGTNSTSDHSLQRSAKNLEEWTAHLSSSTYREVVNVLKSFSRNELNSKAPVQPWLHSVVKFLCEEGDHFTVDELVAAFRTFSPYRRSEDAGYFLSRIREKSSLRWRQVIRKAFNARRIRTSSLIGYLADHDDGFLLPDVRQRLEHGSYSQIDFHSLLDYFLQYTPPANTSSTLWRCYRLANLSRWAQSLVERKSRDHTPRVSAEDVFQPLLHLMNLPDEEAWTEFRYLLDRDSVPLIRRRGLRNAEIPTPQNLTHVQTLLDWYVRIRQSIDQVGDTHRDRKHFADAVMSKITSFGGVEVLHMLRGVQKDAPYENAPWLSGTIMNVESQILSGSIEQRPSSSLLRMIARDHYHHVQSEKDLFEATCEAIESLDDDFRSGQGIAGFWDTDGEPDTPKHEAQCQNGLWPRLRDRLRAYGVRGVEEEVINENFADFRIDYLRPHKAPLSTFIELKVARKEYSTSDLVGPIEDQLYDEHLRPSGCSHGIFVVLWFKKSDGYDYPTKWDDAGALRDDLEARAEEVQSRYGVTIATYVLDVTAGFRRR